MMKMPKTLKEEYDNKYPYDPQLKFWLNGMENCKKCKRLVKCRQAIYPGYGSPKSIIMFIGANPGMVPRYRITGIVFRGNKSGNYFLDTLKQFNINFDQVFTTNICKCGANDGKKNLSMDKLEIDNCLLYLKQEIKIIKPKIIVTVGSLARENLPKIKEVDDTIIHHVYHPAFILRKKEMKGEYINQWKKISKLYFKILNETKNKQTNLTEF